MDLDQPVKETCKDALSSRWSAVKKGYLKDEYIKYLYIEPTEIKPPMINRGRTFIRSFTIDHIVLEEASKCKQSNQELQILSLGAGMDTRYFYIKEEFDKLEINFKYFEVDFEDITVSKINKVCKNEDLKKQLNGEIILSHNKNNLSSDNYVIISGDLRKFKEEIYPNLLKYNFNKNLPTLILAECVLVYVEPELVDNMFRYLLSELNQITLLSYEPSLDKDPFSQMMVNNLNRRGIKLKGTQLYSNLRSQKNRYLSLGFLSVSFSTVWNIERNLLNEQVLEHLNKIERLDEVEEWMLLAEHYGFLLATKQEKGDDLLSKIKEKSV
ncbi:leucine carboxyl methyltransferase 1-like protein [Neoconidiobolus thromboides FSU 785]|nr:leucine carboxyl methyltransferase 1-like protein [Neoconidiobolus thromboides FSU 785]